MCNLGLGLARSGGQRQHDDQRDANRTGIEILQRTDRCVCCRGLVCLTLVGVVILVHALLHVHCVILLRTVLSSQLHDLSKKCFCD